MNILSILEDIGSDSKRGHKLSLIESNKGNALFMNVLKLALDPYTNFYIRKIPQYVTKSNNQQTLDWALVELKKLSERQLTGHAGIEHLRSILSSLSADDAIVIERIIGKDLRCGAADGIVNAVVKDFIPSYPCLLARPYDEKNIKNIRFQAYSQLKADGLRVNFHVDAASGTVLICGRSGREIDLLGHMDESFLRLGAQYDAPHVFDGELIVVGPDGKRLSRKEGNGIINKAIKGTISDEEAKMVRAQLWDAIPLSEFTKGASTEIYKDRFEFLVTAIQNSTPTGMDATASILKGNLHKFWIIPFRIVNNLDEAVEHFNSMLEEKEEGTILKNFHAIWEDSRSKHLVKMKAEKTADLEIIGWNPGEGKFVGQVGSIICASSDRKVKVSISGFSDELRQWITDNIDKLMGTIVEVLYNERISSKSKGRGEEDSLFLPRYSEFRTDKFVADSSAEIK